MLNDLINFEQNWRRDGLRDGGAFPGVFEALEQDPPECRDGGRWRACICQELFSVDRVEVNQELRFLVQVLEQKVRWYLRPASVQVVLYLAQHADGLRLVALEKRANGQPCRPLDALAEHAQ